jgi:hypothetical protein
LCHNDFFADSARDQIGEQGVQPTTDLVVPPAQVTVTFGQEPQHRSGASDCPADQHAIHDAPQLAI